MKSRCKMTCNEVTENANNGFSYVLYPVCSVEDNPENDEFFKFTPSGKLELSCSNDQGFKVDKEYYIDITEA